MRDECIQSMCITLSSKSSQLARNKIENFSMELLSIRPVPNYLKAAMNTVLQLNEKEADNHGDILVFVPGQVW